MTAKPPDLKTILERTRNRVVKLCRAASTRALTARGRNLDEAGETAQQCIPIIAELDCLIAKLDGDEG